MATPFRTVLVANRGEIAVRVLRAATEAGYRTVAVYSEADASAPHVALADTAVPIGPAPVGRSYLDMERVLNAARLSGADAIHPGYGMLSENAAFARACEAAGVAFIGPSADAISLMGDKGRARQAAQAALVPCVPGYDGDDQAASAFAAEAKRIGFPVMVKAAAGGGGRGMRRVERAEDLETALRDAANEATAAFGDGRLLLERAVDGARHVEVQVAADQHGHVVHLGERDCSVQRRFQKVIEEAPSPVVSPELRAALGEAAVQLAKACEYTGVGTVEFLLGSDGQFYFLEMNTRLQVEHPVTECVTGVDLVQLQFRIAEGHPLPISQPDVRIEGHAIEARVCLEDPSLDFRPQTGRVLGFRTPDPALARVDHGLSEGLEISPHYDSMVAKVIAHGATRADALRKLDKALSDLSLLGVVSNRDFLRAVLGHPVFSAGEATIAFIAEHGQGLLAPSAPDATVWALAALAWCERPRLCADREGALPDHFTNAPALTSLVYLACGEAQKQLAVSWVRRPPHVLVLEGDTAVRLERPVFEPGAIAASAGETRLAARVAFDGHDLYLESERGSYRFVDETRVPAAAREAVGDGRIRSAMAGTVVRVEVGVDATVKAGDTLAVLEAMKLQHHIVADIDGRVAAVHITEGAQVAVGEPLFALEAP